MIRREILTTVIHSTFGHFQSPTQTFQIVIFIAELYNDFYPQLLTRMNTKLYNNTKIRLKLLLACNA